MGVARLAFFNVWRRLSRSTLALIAMAIAAAVLTSGLSISHGVPSGAYEIYREYFEGEILVFSPGFIGAGPLQASDAPIVRRHIVDSGFSQLLRFFPSLGDRYYAEEGWQYRPLDETVLSQFVEMGGIAGYNPHYVMPATASRGTAVTLKTLPGSNWPITAAVEGQKSDFDVVINAYAGLRDEAGNPIQTGRVIDVVVPRFALDSHGFPMIDSTAEAIVYQARVVQVLSIPTRSFSWSNPASGEIDFEQAYVHAPEVYLPEDLWKEMWATHSGGARYPITSAGLLVEDMGEINILTQSLRENHVQLAFFPIQEFVSHLNRYSLLDRFYRAPPYLWRGESQESHPMSHQDFGFIAAGLLLLNAGMLLASQMLTAVAGRRNEIGILKAVGARKRDVTGMIMMEALILAFMGGSAGFLLVRAAAVHQSITNSIPLVTIMLATVREFGFVLGLTLLASLVFGVLPAWKVAKLTVMEVFRNE